jgi:hypothetical protein
MFLRVSTILHPCVSVINLRCAEIPTLLIAGHETTASGIIWVLFALAQRIDVQERLRDELRSLPLPTSSDSSSNVSLDGETLDQLDPLPFLDAVVRKPLADLSVRNRHRARRDVRQRHSRLYAVR